MDKHAQIGKAFTGAAALVFIIVILGVFLALTTILSLERKNDYGLNYPFVEPGFALYKNMVYTNDQNLKQTSTILDKWISIYSDNKKIEDVAPYLIPLVNNDKDCFIIFDEKSNANTAGSWATSAGTGGFMKKIIDAISSKATNFLLPRGIAFVYKDGKVSSSSFDTSLLTKQDYDQSKFNLGIFTLPIKKETKTLYIEYYLGKCGGKQ